LLEGSHLESVFRLVGLLRTGYIIFNLILGSLYIAGYGCYKVGRHTILFHFYIFIFLYFFVCLSVYLVVF
jgi:hypothetical protein